MNARITLRLKSDPNIELPEAEVKVETENMWSLLFGTHSEWVVVYKADWEHVPPPYTLPERVGAVVAAPDGRVFIHSPSRTAERDWFEWKAGGWYGRGHLKSIGVNLTLSEGVDL